VWCSPEKQIAADQAISDRQDRKADGGRRNKNKNKTSTTTTTTTTTKRFHAGVGSRLLRMAHIQGGTATAVLLQLEVGVGGMCGGRGRGRKRRRRSDEKIQ
jgi:hypothetical protein